MYQMLIPIAMSMASSLLGGGKEEGGEKKKQKGLESLFAPHAVDQPASAPAAPNDTAVRSKALQNVSNLSQQQIPLPTPKQAPVQMESELSPMPVDEDEYYRRPRIQA